MPFIEGFISSEKKKSGSLSVNWIKGKKDCFVYSHNEFKFRQSTTTPEYIRQWRKTNRIRTKIVLCVEHGKRDKMPLKLASLILGHSFTQIQIVTRCRCSNSKTHEQVRQLIRTHTEVTTDHMTPEMQLHLITPKCALWYSRGEDVPFSDPFWAFYWPGGQVLSRFVLDNPRLFTEKRVLDIGSGCGASAIAGKMSGAHTVCANDTDRVAIEAIKMNCDLNGVCMDTLSDDIIGRQLHGWDIVFLGDMFYDLDFADKFSVWLPQLSQGGIDVLVGDPGRLPLVNHPLRRNLVSLFQCPLPESCLRENSGMTMGTVWKFKC